LAFSQLLRFAIAPEGGGRWGMGGSGTAYAGASVWVCICVRLELAKIAAHVTLWSRAAFRSSSARTDSSSFSFPSSAGPTALKKSMPKEIILYKLYLLAFCVYI